MVFVEGAAAQFFGAVKGFAEAFAGEQGVPVQGAVSCRSKGIASGVVSRRARGRSRPALWDQGRLGRSTAAVALQVEAHQRQQAGAQPDQAAQVTAAHPFAGQKAQRHHGTNAPQRRMLDTQAVLQRTAHAAQALQGLQQLAGLVANLLAVHFQAQAQQRLAQFPWVTGIR